MTQEEFENLSRDDLEKLKFVLDSNWDIAIRLLASLVQLPWGSLTWTLSNQTDLQNALNLKLNSADTNIFTDAEQTKVWFVSVTQAVDLDAIESDVNTTIPATYATKDEVKNSSLVYSASSVWTDDYAITISGVVSYIDWMTYRIKCDVANTWTATLNINGLWAKALKKNQWQEDLIDGDIFANWIVTATYNSSLNVFQFVWQEATVVAGEVTKTTSLFTAWEDIEVWRSLYMNADWSVYKTDASDSTKINFVWYATETITSWNPISVNTSWIDSNQTWLTIAKSYFLDNPQIVSTSPWTNIVQALWNWSVWWAENVIWYSTAQWKQWQSFTAVSDDFLWGVILSLIKKNAPTDNLECRLYASDKTTLIATATNVIAWATISTSFSDHTFNFDNIQLVNWTWYFLEVVRSWSVNTTNYFGWNDYWVDVYAWWSSFKWSTTVWTATTWDKTFTLEILIWVFDNWFVSLIPWDNVVKVWESISATAMNIISTWLTPWLWIKCSVAQSVTWTWVNTFTHWLWKIPDTLVFNCSADVDYNSTWFWNSTEQKALKFNAPAVTAGMYNERYTSNATISNVTATTYDVQWSSSVWTDATWMCTAFG